MVVRLNTIMYIFNLYIQSKHKNYIYRFSKLFFNKSKKHFKSMKFTIQKKRHNSLFSLLTSPHVNKKAQEQFSNKKFHIQIKIHTFEPLKLSLFLKRVCLNLFPNIKIRIKLNRADDLINTSESSVSVLVNTKLINSKKILLRLMDNYGEKLKTAV